MTPAEQYFTAWVLLSITTRSLLLRGDDFGLLEFFMSMVGSVGMLYMAIKF